MNNVRDLAVRTVARAQRVVGLHAMSGSPMPVSRTSIVREGA